MTSTSHANPNFGRGIVSLRPEEVEVLDMAEVVWRLHALFKSPTYKPPRLPEVALKLLAMMRSSDVQLRRITAVLEEDQLLAAEILRLAQSAAYASATGAAVRSLEEALVRLGQQRTADILLEASLNQRVFRVKAYQRQMDELRRHSTAVAHLARLVSRQTSLYDEHVFMCGLLHDVGVAGALIAFAEAVPRGQEPPAFDDVSAAIWSAHQAAGATLARLWKLPPELLVVIEHHHDFMVHGHVHPTAAVVELANWMAERVGAAAAHESKDDSALAAARALGLTQETVDRLLAQAQELVDGLGAG